PGATGDSSSLFVKVRERVVEMPPVVAEAQHSVAKHFIPFYFGPGDTWHYIRGNKSIVRIAERKPVFLTKVNPSAFLLLKLAYQAERDIRYAVSTGSAYKNSLPIKVTKQPGDVFELTPGSELEPGEYAFVTSTTFYDFGIE
ncbi:MAG TPA: hypothetical protein VEU07_08080, partial [Candidatus Acidoferrum sp.]|nr:hypothetical protein [Candidatus Acidoferrum sp.]